MCWLQAKELPTFKDNDFVNDGAVIKIGAEEKEKLMQMLQKDVEVNFGLLDSCLTPP